VLHYFVAASSLVHLRGRYAAYILILLLLLSGSRAVTAFQRPKIDSRFIWQCIDPVIQQHTAGRPYKLTVVELNHEGLAFYSRKNIESIEIESNSIHSFYPVKGLIQKCDELLSADSIQVFLISSKRAKKLVAELDKRSIHYSVEQGPFDYKLIFCQPSAARTTAPEAAGGAAHNADSVLNQ
jgi:hypothetical protein